MQTDPIGIAGGINLYAYVGNDPVNAVDAWGLQEWPPEDTVPDVMIYGCRPGNAECRCRRLGIGCIFDPFEIGLFMERFNRPSGLGFNGGDGGDGGVGGGFGSASESQQRCERLLRGSEALGGVAQGFGYASNVFSAAGMVAILVPGGQIPGAAARGTGVGLGIVSFQLEVAQSVTYGAATGDWGGASANVVFGAINNFAVPGTGGAGDELADLVGGFIGDEIVNFSNFMGEGCAGR